MTKVDQSRDAQLEQINYQKKNLIKTYIYIQGKKLNSFTD